MRKLLILLLCLTVHGMARGQTNTYEYHYWFDDQSEAVVSGQFNAPGGHIDISTDGLDYKLHYLHLQVKDTAGVWSSPITHMFQKQTSEADGPVTYHIWANEDTEHMYTGSLNGDTLHLDMSHLRDGIQQLYMQMSQGNDYSVPVTKTFIKLPHAEGMGYLFCMMNIDGTPFRMERLPMSGGAATWVIDTDSLVTGIHRYTIMAVTPTGYATSIREGFFVRENMASQLANQHCCYQVDGGEAVVVDGTINGDQYHFDLDMSGIANGLHKLTYWMVSDNGATTEIHTSLFIKIPLGGTGVKAYDYWLNDDFDNRHTTTLSKVQDPFKLISLLPVESVPLRSSNFKFAFKGDQPVVYAQNDFHIRFLDARVDAGDRYVEITKQFVDEKVWEEVNPVAEIQPTQTFDRVEENGIRWYTVTVEEGDTVAFKTSQACTLQLFSPSGEEVYQASGEFSVAFGGCHTWETGTYYLAVHDVMGTQPAMTLDYMHMDKYDIASQDVHVVGNGGCSTITFKGNGFRDLYEVVLTGPDGTTITSMMIGHESDAETSVIFDFADVALGEYDVIFHFTEGDKSLSQVLTVEEPVDIELATNVAFPESFLRGTSVTYTVTITNKGNMTAYKVPIYTWIMNRNEADGISYIKFDGLGLPSLMESIGKDSLSIEDIIDIQALSDEIGDDHYFLRFYVEDEDNPEDSVYVRTGYFFIDVAPNETKSLYLTLTANENVWAYFTVSDDWFSISSKANSQNAKRYAKRGAIDKYCCIHTDIECWLNVASTLFDWATVGLIAATPETGGWSDVAAGVTAAAGCITGFISTVSTFSASLMCGEGMPNFGDFIGNGISTLATGASCGGYFKKLKNYKDMLKKMSSILRVPNSVSTGFSCHSSTKRKPNCPPPPPGGGGSNIRNSCEPNEIYGTTSPSGSIYLTDSVQTVNYRIQFENDSVFATAAAQTVIVRDTLDTHYLDLSTFSPTFVKIADDMYEVDGSPNFVKTIDMRPKINTIVQVNCDLDEEQGIATWTFRSLDPMTMEPVTDVERGFLPVNYDGISGIGEVAFDIGLKQPLPNGTEISNRSGNIFDSNEPVMTPYWTNIIDAVAPESAITSYHIVNDSTMTLRFNGIDNLSGVWKYDVYACYGEGAAPFKVAEDVTDNECDIRIYQGIVHGIFVVATDSAGNREQKFAPEITIPVGYTPGDVNHNNTVDVIDVMMVVYDILGYSSSNYYENEADVNKDGEINIIDVMDIVHIILYSDYNVPHNARVANNTNLSIESKGRHSTLRLAGDERFTACQMTVQLPEGCSLKSAKLNSQAAKSHSMEYRDLGEGLYKMVVFSLEGSELDNDTPLLDIVVDGRHADNLQVTDIQCCNSHFESVVLADVGTGATGIDNVHIDGKRNKTYDTHGIQVDNPTKGVYIQSGKKVVVH